MRLWKILLVLLVLTGSGPSALASIPLAPKNPCTGHFRGVVSGYRYYSPTQGRWIGRDSAGEQKGGNNLFGFCDNNALSTIDSDGRIMMPGEPEWSLELNDMADWLELAARAQTVGDSAAFRTAQMFANAASQRAMNGIVAEGGLASGEAGFVAPELLSTVGTVVGGVGLAYGAGLVIGYVVDQTSQALGAVVKAQTAANNAVIDYWSDPDIKYDGP
jgi:RHS repeat-associated protein